MVYGKVPPQAKDLEEAVLGAIMLEKNAFDTIVFAGERAFHSSLLFLTASIIKYSSLHIIATLQLLHLLTNCAWKIK